MLKNCLVRFIGEKLCLCLYFVMQLEVEYKGFDYGVSASFSKQSLSMS